MTLLPSPNLIFNAFCLDLFRGRSNGDAARIASTAGSTLTSGQQTPAHNFAACEEDNTPLNYSRNDSLSSLSFNDEDERPEEADEEFEAYLERKAAQQRAKALQSGSNHRGE